MAAAARDALAKIEGVTSQSIRVRMDAVQLFAPPTHSNAYERDHIDQLHDACIASRFIHFHYTSLAGERVPPEG